MSRRRAVLALSVFSLLALLLFTVVPPVRAQTQTDRTEEAVDEAEATRRNAYEVVDSAVAEREAVEDRLFEVLDRYQTNSELLEEISASLQQLTETLAVAEARRDSTRDVFEEQAVTAYIEAVATTSVIVLESDDVESALVTQETLGRSTRETLARLDGFLAFSDEVESIRAVTATRSEETVQIQAQLSADATELQELFAIANTEVASAYEDARAAEALLAEANAAALAAQRAATTSTTTPSTPTAPSTTGSTSPPSTGATTTSMPQAPTTTTLPATTTTDTGGSPSLTISAATRRWRSLLEMHFAPNLVEDALVIIECESVGNPDAVNPYSGASGLFQFIPGTWAVASVEAGVSGRSVFDPEANIIAASWLAGYYQSRGNDPWRPWGCRRYL